MSEVISKRIKAQTLFIGSLLLFVIGIADARQPMAEDERIKKGHPKLQGVLHRLYEEHQKGPASTERFAKQKDVKISEDKVMVFLYAETGKVEDIDDEALHLQGARI